MNLHLGNVLCFSHFYHLRPAWRFERGSLSFPYCCHEPKLRDTVHGLMCNATHGTRRYFQSLASPSQALQLSKKSPAPRPGVRSPSPVMDEAQNHKRKYLRLLAKRQKNEKSENNMQVGGHAREEAKDSVVSFTMKWFAGVSA